MPKYQQFRTLPKPGGGAFSGSVQESRVIEVPEGHPLPANAVAVSDETPTSDWAPLPTESEE